MNRNEPKPARGAKQGYRGRANKGRAFASATKSSRTGKSDDDVPILKFGPNNNFVTFKERLSTACLELYGGLGKLIALEKYWVPPKVNKEDFIEVDESGEKLKETDELVKTAILQAVKERVALIARMKSNRESMYAYITSKLSKESLDEVKRHKNYDSFSETNDPLELWLAIKELHSVATTSKVEGVVKRKAWEEYAMCKQGAFEDIRDYKVKFDNKYESYVAHGNPEKRSEEDRAMDFLEGLDKSRY